MRLIEHEKLVSLVQASWLSGTSPSHLVKWLEDKGYALSEIQVTMMIRAYAFLNRELSKPFVFTIHW